MNNFPSKKQKEVIAQLSELGCTRQEIWTRLNLPERVKIHLLLAPESHPLNRLYWQGRIQYIAKLRQAALDIAVYSSDWATRAKMLLFLLKENTEAFSRNRLQADYIDIIDIIDIRELIFNHLAKIRDDFTVDQHEVLKVLQKYQPCTERTLKRNSKKIKLMQDLGCVLRELIAKKKIVDIILKNGAIKYAICDHAA